jgi:hypothetical protein
VDQADTGRAAYPDLKKGENYQSGPERHCQLKQQQNHQAIIVARWPEKSRSAVQICRAEAKGEPLKNDKGRLVILFLQKIKVLEPRARLLHSHK